MAAGLPSFPSPTAVGEGQGEGVPPAGDAWVAPTEIRGARRVIAWIRSRRRVATRGRRAVRGSGGQRPAGERRNTRRRRRAGDAGGRLGSGPRRAAAHL